MGALQNGVLQKYKSEPLKCWTKAKELRAKIYRELAEANSLGRIVVSGGTEGFASSLPSGLGDHVYLGGEAYGATLGADPEFSKPCLEAIELHGFARDMCAYTKNYFGSILTNRYYFGGKFPKPTFCLQLHICDTHAKWYQLVSEHYNVPYFCVDIPLWVDDDRIPIQRKYVIDQLHEAIEWIEKTFHKKYDDEKLIETVINEYNCHRLWGETCLLNKAIPAPLDIKTIFSLYVVSVIGRNRKETVEFFRELRDEVQDRVNRNIAALATERCRLLEDSQPAWSMLRMYRYMEEYGVVVLGSVYTFGLTGSYEIMPDGSWQPKRTLEERNKVPRNREEALEILTELSLQKPIEKALPLPHQKSEIMRMLVRDFKCQGVIMHLNRGCEFNSSGLMENRLAMQDMGIPVLAYEGNMADKRETDEGQIIGRIDSFMESLGLKKLTI